jgi:hypothetical protein
MPKREVPYFGTEALSGGKKAIRRSDGRENTNGKQGEEGDGAGRGERERGGGYLVESVCGGDNRERLRCLGS